MRIIQARNGRHVCVSYPMSKVTYSDILQQIIEICVELTICPPLARRQRIMVFRRSVPLLAAPASGGKYSRTNSKERCRERTLQHVITKKTIACYYKETQDNERLDAGCSPENKHRFCLNHIPCRKHHAISAAGDIPRIPNDTVKFSIRLMSRMHGDLTAERIESPYR